MQYLLPGKVCNTTGGLILGITVFFVHSYAPLFYNRNQMKYSTRSVWILIVFLLYSLSSCETDPDIMNDEAANKLFVWGCVDMQSGKHQVRIRESIQDEGDMFELAKDPKMSLPNDSLLVNLILYTPTETIVLKMHPVIYPKDDGVFATEQNVIHEVNYQIPKGSRCSLFINNLVTGDTITSPLVEVEAPGFLYPLDFGWYVPTYSFTNGEEPFHVTFNVYGNLVQKLVTEIKYVDLLLNGDTVCQKAIFESQPIYGGFGFNELNRTFPLDYVFNICNRIIPEDPEVKFRWFYRFNFKGFAASEGLRDYWKLGDRFNDNRKLIFTNITGGYGVFYACDGTETGDIEPSRSFPDTLSSSPKTVDLKFSRYIYPGTYIDPDHE